MKIKHTMQKKVASAVLFFFIMLLLAGCGKSDSSEQNDSGNKDHSLASKSSAQRKVRDKSDISPLNESSVARSFKKERISRDRPQNPQSNMTATLLQKIQKIDGRYLEYKVHLTFKTKDLIQSRNLLLELAGKYGFVKKSSGYWEITKPYVYSELHINKEKLLQVLIQIEKIGKLISENIQVVDHTNRFTWSEIKLAREKKRQQRKANLMQKVDRKSIVQVERLLEKNEDNEDKAKFEKIKIQDAIQWAKLYVRIEGPAQPVSWDLPDFRNAFIHAIQFTLIVFYAFIVILPLLLLLWIVWWQRKRIRSLFSRKNKKTEKTDKE